MAASLYAVTIDNIKNVGKMTAGVGASLLLELRTAGESSRWYNLGAPPLPGESCAPALVTHVSASPLTIKLWLKRSVFPLESLGVVTLFEFFLEASSSATATSSSAGSAPTAAPTALPASNNLDRSDGLAAVASLPSFMQSAASELLPQWLAGRSDDSALQNAVRCQVYSRSLLFVKISHSITNLICLFLIFSPRPHMH